MRRSGIPLLGRSCTRSNYYSLRLQSFTSSCQVHKNEKSFLQSKLASVEGHIPGEQWFLNLASTPPSRFVSYEEDGPVWRTQLTRRPGSNDGSKLFREDGSVTIDPIYLRDACRCELCVDPSTLQRKFNTAHIPPNIEAVFAGRSDRGRVKVRWENDVPGFRANHLSIFSQTDLRSITSPAPDSPVARKRHYWDRATFEKRGNWTPYADFLNNPEAYKAALSALDRDGLIFITQLDANEGAIETIASRIGPLRNTFYGPTWDVRSVPNSKNVAYTNQYLGFHMDLLYMANPPGYQLLHCLKNSCSGGESRFADSFFAATRLRRSNAKAYTMLCRYPVEWTYNNDGQHYLQRRHTFEEVFRFVSSEEMARHRLRHKEKNDIEADLGYVNWSPPFQGRLFHKPEFPERTKLFIDAAREFDRTLNGDDMVFEFKMEEGTCAIFENRRVVHARNAFTMEGGERWLKGAYVDEEAFWSTMKREGIAMADGYNTEGIPQPEEPIVRKYEAPGSNSPADRRREVVIRPIKL